MVTILGRPNYLVIIPCAFPVPSSPPFNVTIFSISSTTIGVMWDDVQQIDHNGVLITFEILYVPLETFIGVLYSTVVNISASNRSVILTGLQEYVEYNISVRAYTSVGAGPFSLAISARTSEMGIKWSICDEFIVHQMFL